MKLDRRRFLSVAAVAVAHARVQAIRHRGAVGIDLRQGEVECHRRKQCGDLNGHDRFKVGLWDEDRQIRNNQDECERHYHPEIVIGGLPCHQPHEARLVEGHDALPEAPRVDGGHKVGGVADILVLHDPAVGIDSLVAQRMRRRLDDERGLAGFRLDIEGKSLRVERVVSKPGLKGELSRNQIDIHFLGKDFARPRLVESSDGDLAVVGSIVYFSANDGYSGNQLWRSDGSASGTYLVRDIRIGPSGSYPSLLTNVEGVLFFSANNGVNGYELWRSDGSATGTILLKDIRSGPDGSFPGEFAVVGGFLYFAAADGVAAAEVHSDRQLQRLGPAPAQRPQAPQRERPGRPGE
mgnify:CR=1 FL=1